MNSGDRYDVCLSFAGEDREYVEQVASQLVDNGVSVFYDKYEQESLWGKDLYQHLDSVYQHKARYCVIFISENYANKLWTKHELRSAQARAFRESREYILPARFDQTEIPGIPDTVGYIGIANLSPADFAEIICAKIGKASLGDSSKKSFEEPLEETNDTIQGNIFKNAKLRKIHLRKVPLRKVTLVRR
jgi:hypothetical protein